MTARTIAWLLAGAATLAAVDGACAQTNVATTEHVRAELLAPVEVARPGDTITLGLNQRIKSRWHTYWRNPGDSGQATAIAWTLPAGASAGDILWPAPRRIDIGPVSNYGYENDVTLLTEIKIPADAKAGATFPIKAAVDWLVCEDICIPEQVTLALDLRIEAEQQLSPRGASVIEAARARIPSPAPWPVSVNLDANDLTLRIASTDAGADRIETLSFFPNDWGVIEHAAQHRVAFAPDGATLTLTRTKEKLPDRLRGVLVVAEKNAPAGMTRAFDVDLAWPAGTAIASSTVAAASPAAALAPPAPGLALAMLWALIGGLILNLMPCVFPVLSIKVMSLVTQSGAPRATARAHGFAYVLGVLASFAFLSAVVIALKSAGATLGWGFQFQSPVFVAMIAFVLFAVGLSQSGVFTIGAGAGRAGGILAGKGGQAGSFLTGVLAAVVATPCTAPFMATAIAFAVTQPAPGLTAIFLSLGLGLALPFLVLSLYPRFLRFLPRPGAWMERFKQFMAFPMYAAAAWLVWVLGQQAGIDAVAAALAGMILIALGAWLFETTRMSARPTRRLGAALGALAAALAIAAALWGIGTGSGPATTAQAPQSGFEPYSPSRLAALRAEGKPVFLNFTAAWCVTCLVNERVALNQASVKDAFAAGGVVYLKGDWTRRDAAITAKLAEFARNGVPLYVFYPAGPQSRPVVLPQILTTGIVLREIASSRKTDISMR